MPDTWSVSPPVEATSPDKILKRTGVVLLVVGLIDIGVMIYCIANKISYSSSFNIFAVIAGVLLLRGNLRAASAVRWFSLFLLAGFLTLIVAWPLVEPVDLTLTRFRLSPRFAAGTLALSVFMLGLPSWLYSQLGSQAVLAARAAAGHPPRDMRIPAIAGVSLVLLLVALMSFFLSSESASKARSIAEQKLGPDYRYHASSLNIRMNSNGRYVSGMVTAWNDKEIRIVPVRWEEQ